MYELEASKHKKATEASPAGVLAITRTGGAAAEDKGLATFFTTERATVDSLYASTTVCSDAAAITTSALYAKCLDDAYYVADALRRHVGYSTGTTFNQNVLKTQKHYTTVHDFNPQEDIAAESSITLSDTSLTTLSLLETASWYHIKYYTHSIQFFSIIDMILVEDWAISYDLGSDSIKKIFIDDMIDSVRLQEIVTKAREYVDFGNATTPTDSTVQGEAKIAAASLTVAKTPQWKLKIAYAYEKTKITNSSDRIADTSAYTKNTFNSALTPTMLWLNKIPLAKGLVNLKTDFDENVTLLASTLATTTA